MKATIILNSIFIVLLCLILGACNRIEESKNAISDSSYYPDGDDIFVYKQDDLLLFCTYKDIGKLIGEPTMKIASVMYLPRIFTNESHFIKTFTIKTFTNESHFIAVRNDKNVAKYFDVYNDKIIDNQNIEKINTFIPLSSSDRYRSLFYAKEQDNTKPQQFNNRPQRFFEHQSVAQNSDYEAFIYKEEVSDYEYEFIGMISSTEGFLWEIPLTSIIKMRNNITKDNLKNPSKNSRIIGDILYLQLDYKVRYNNFSRRTSEDNISTICAIDKLTGKIIWIYDTYEFSTAKLVENSEK